MTHESKIMYTRTSLLAFLMLLANSAYSFDFDITSFRTTLSKPDTSHTLIFEPQGIDGQKTVFNLTPLNNERLGFFVDVNGIEIGYAVDVFENSVETKTQNFLFSYRKLKHSRITLNYQILEGLETEAENLRGVGAERRFLETSKSSKIELFGLHNLYTFGEGESLFEHFFLNRPVLSNKFDWSLSVVGGWSLKYLSLESPNSILFDAEFIQGDIPQVTELKSTSFSANVGPLLSVNLPNNFNFFAEYKYGKGHIKNENSSIGLKQSGDEKSKALGVGFSWASQDKKTLVLIRGWDQKGRHIETSFGDLSVVRFF